jgi:hypothetical protein
VGFKPDISFVAIVVMTKLTSYYGSIGNKLFDAGNSRNAPSRPAARSKEAQNATARATPPKLIQNTQWTVGVHITQAFTKLNIAI